MILLILAGIYLKNKLRLGVLMRVAPFDKATLAKPDIGHCAYDRGDPSKSSYNDPEVRKEIVAPSRALALSKVQTPVDSVDRTSANR